MCERTETVLNYFYS